MERDNICRRKKENEDNIQKIKGGKKFEEQERKTKKEKEEHIWFAEEEKREGIYLLFIGKEKGGDSLCREMFFGLRHIDFSFVTI